ncbi:HAAS signaling domain-containing protein [Aquibacillus albus]|uniref:Membrane protein n=1 Tax=Aquibacillus albus TaxID=1168171 RepID=A0ABS2MXD2_9BACI|nr:DUF1700 domain-containing protein [Aquibacillus albus]MBM7570545.1 putative membrane protein [Aquibacillus albus]
MTKKDFLKELDYRLRKVPQQKRKEIIDEYEEQFDIGFTEGKTEAEVAAALGIPKMIADDILADVDVQVIEKGNPTTSISRVIIAAIGLFFFNLIFLLGPVVAIIAVYLSFSAVGIAFSLTPLAWLVSIVLGQAANVLGEFFIVLTVSSLGVLISIGMMYVGKGLIKGIGTYVKFNIRVIKG